MAIIKRLDKGSELTYAELDGNFDHLTAEDAAIRAEFAAADVSQASIAQTALNNHINDTSAAHADSAITFSPAGTGAVSTTVQAKLRESISVKDFGAVGDGETDDTTAIQAAIDAAIALGVGKVYCPGGSYLISDTIHIGYGDSFSCVFVEGDGPKYRGTNPSGTAWIANFSDRPAVNFQGARASSIKGIAIVGLLTDWIADNDLGGSAPLVDDTDGANWVDATLDADQDSQYAPYAGISIDAYAGTAPATAYPGTYGKSQSSMVTIEECYVGGFTVGIVNAPCNADGNGDFTNIKRCVVERCKYAFSVGNSQSRNFGIDGCSTAQCFITITNNTHGKQIGKINGTISNLAVGQTINIFNLSSSPYFGPLRILHLYAESIWRLGAISTGSANENSITFDHCSFTFGLQTSSRGVPANVLDGFGSAVSAVFEGCQFSNFNSVLPFITAISTNVQFKGCSVQRSAALTTVYERLGANVLCGGLVLVNPGLGLRTHDITFDSQAITSGGAIVARRVVDGVWQSSRELPIPVYASYVIPSITFGQPIFVQPYPNTQNKATLSALSLTDKTLTMTFSARTDATFAVFGPDCGDVIVDQSTGMTFFVSARTGTTVTAIAQNNYKDDGAGGFDTVTAFDTSTGTLTFIVSRKFSPSSVIFATVTSGSNTLTNCQNAAGTGFTDAEIVVGDALYIDRTFDAFFTNSELVVTAKDATAKTITMGGNADETLSKQRLGIFVRKPPDNV